MILSYLKHKNNLTFLVVWSLFFTFLVSIVLPISIPQTASGSGPGGIVPTPLLWLDATDIDSNTATANPTNGSQVTSWKDKSSNSNDASILSGQGTPTYAASSPINNGPAIHFARTNDSSGQVFVVNGVDIRAGTTPDVTVFAVYRAETATSGSLYGIWGQDNGAWDRFAICCGYLAADQGVIGLPPSGFAVAGAGTGTRLLTVVYDGTVSGGINYGPTGGSSVWFEGGQVTTFTDSTTASTADGPGSIGAKPNFRIGWDGDGSAFNGWISEVIIFGSALSSADIVTVSNYLGEKYNLTIAPTPVTQVATSVTSSTATLNGTVNAHNDTTTALAIQFSIDSSSVLANTATNPTVSPSQVSGNTNVSVSASISGLSPGTTYYFRVSATNSKGSNTGELLSFTTLETTISSCVNSEGNLAGSITNGSFENIESRTALAESPPVGWQTTALPSRNSVGAVASPYTKAVIEVTNSNAGAASGFNAYAGNRMVEIAADAAGDSSTAVRQGLYQDVNTINGSRIFWSYWHHARGTAGDNQVSVFRAAPTPANLPAGSIFTASEQANPFGSGVTDLTTVYDTVTASSPSSSWKQSRGSFVATSDKTRLLFQNFLSPTSGTGNLIDDVRFTVYQACPISVKIVSGRTATLTIKNSEQTTGTPNYYAPAAATVSIASASANLSSLTVSNSANTSSTFTIVGSSLGIQNSTYRVSYTVDGQTYTSISTLSVEVLPEITAKRPVFIPFDPTLVSKSLPGIKFATASSGYVCYTQVANSNGDVISSPTITLNRRLLLSGVTSVQSDSTIIDSGTVNNLSSQASYFQITSNVGKLGLGGSKFIKVQASSIDNTDDSSPSCSNGISFIIEFRRIKITQTRTFTVPQKNGKQT